MFESLFPKFVIRHAIIIYNRLKINWVTDYARGHVSSDIGFSRAKERGENALAAGTGREPLAEHARAERGLRRSDFREQPVRALSSWPEAVSGFHAF